MYVRQSGHINESVSDWKEKGPPSGDWDPGGACAVHGKMGLNKFS